MATLSEILMLIANDECVVITDYSDEGCELESNEVYGGPVFGVPFDILHKYGLFPVKNIRTSLNAKCEVEVEIFNMDDFFDEEGEEAEGENNDETE